MNRRTPQPESLAAAFRRAFTLIELLVVIAIFLILLAIAVPAFAAMLYSSEESMAENTVRSGLGGAHDAAVRSPKGRDVCAVFFYDATTQHTQILTCVSVGFVKDDPPPGSASANLIEREVFAPVPGALPAQLPRGWSARGYAPSNTIDGQWYGDTSRGAGGATTAPNLYSATAAMDRGNWLFPETDFYDDTRGNAGVDRQTFMVRFEGGTGAVSSPDETAVLVLAPSVQSSAATMTNFRNSAPWNYVDPQTGQHPYNPTEEADPARFVRRITGAPATGAGSLTTLQRKTLLGNISSDTILAKPVSQLAVCNEKRLCQALGLRPDANTGCLYQSVAPPATRLPNFIASVTDQTLKDLNSWIEDHLYDPAFPNDRTKRIESDCRIFTVQRYLGSLQEITGTTMGQGVGQ
jgi:prepilin-type N-terminal cleavage/methylation domain-containing protein